jgi:FixJ family two-component response regulator
MMASNDDDPTVGYRTETYASGEEFITTAWSSEADCLVVDIQIGDITGVELGRHLEEIDLIFPIIFMTGSQSEAYRKQAVEFGCAACLTKPFPYDQLVEAITRAIGPVCAA